MRIEDTEVYGFRRAFHAMRNPKESWMKSDSKFFLTTPDDSWPGITIPEMPVIGLDDMKLARQLIKAGGDHRKFLRAIVVWANITVSRACWAEIDTYKVGTVRNSCSTMYKLGSRDLTIADFADGDVNHHTLNILNMMGRCYRNKYPYNDPSGNVHTGTGLLIHMKRHLPEGFLQMAGYKMNYETALKMYLSRKNHRMPEWSGICDWIWNLPYMADFIGAVER